MLGSSNQIPTSDTRVLLLLAHPGDELFVHGWMAQCRPIVLMLTDGSGVRGYSSLASTIKSIRALDARIGDLFGRFTDRGFLNALLMKDHERFVALAEELGDLLVGEEIDLVIGESAEGHSPGGDVCRMLLDAASGLVSRRLRHLRNYEFSRRVDRTVPTLKNSTRLLPLQLDDASWQRKREAMLRSPGMGHLLQQSAEAAGRWRREVLEVAQPWQLLRLEEARSVDYPAPEIGARVRFHEHILPLAETLRLMAACGRAVA